MDKKQKIMERIRHREIAILGASGLVGDELKILNEIAGIEVLAPGREEVDVQDIDSLYRYFKPRPGAFVVNCVAETRVDAVEEQARDDLEENPTGSAMLINAVGLKNVAEVVEDSKGYLVAIGSDFEFSGLADDPGPYGENKKPHPPRTLGVYGRSKRQGFFNFFNSGVEGVYIRIAFPYGNPDSPKDFSNKLVALLKNGYPVVEDQQITPTNLQDLKRLIDWLKQERPPKGVFHVASHNMTDWIECAKLAARMNGYSEDFPRISFAELSQKLPAKRPQYGGLKVEQTEAITDIMMTPAVEGLELLFAQRN